MPNAKIIPRTPTVTPTMMPNFAVDVDEEESSSWYEIPLAFDVGGGHVGIGGVHDQGTVGSGVAGGGGGGAGR